MNRATLERTGVGTKVLFRLWQDSGICGDYARPYAKGSQPMQLVSTHTGFIWVLKTGIGE